MSRRTKIALAVGLGVVGLLGLGLLYVWVAGTIASS